MIDCVLGESKQLDILRTLGGRLVMASRSSQRNTCIHKCDGSVAVV